MLYLRKAILLVVAAASLYAAYEANQSKNQPPAPVLAASDAAFDKAFADRSRDLQLSGRGEVDRVLRDDTKGDRHQKFILRLASGQKLLVAHNIDLAPRIDNLRAGDSVEFYGEYEWNPKGGVIHWTHHDPNGRHIDGWLMHRGKKYQ